MTATEFCVTEVFDLAGRGGLVVVGAGVPRLFDLGTGQPIRVLGVDHPTPRTILVVDRADAEVAEAGRVWKTMS